MVRKNPDFHFQLILLLFLLAVLPMLFLGSQSRLGLLPQAHENNFPTQTPLSYAQPKDQSNIDDLKNLVYVSPTPTPAKTREEILNAPNIFLGKAISFLFSFVKQVVSLVFFAISQFGH